VRRIAGTLAALAALGAPPAAWGQPGAGGDVPGGATTALVRERAVARAAPRHDARGLMALTGRTAYSHRPQELLVTGHRPGPGGDWVRVQLPMRPNGRAGWVPGTAVRLRTTRVRVTVRLGARRVEVWRGAARVARWPAGIGRAATPTPRGAFAVQDVLRTLPGWRGVYGAYTVPLTAHSEVLRSFMGGDGLVAFHGGAPWRVGVPSSNGCVILADGHLRRLAALVRPGTPVRVVA
jgi:lipoprotein-anchoring transpeptidase ErfK/SrfK